MDLLNTAAELFKKNLGDSGNDLNMDTVTSALSGLLGGGDGDLDLGDLLSKVQGSGLASLAASWLGDGDNEDLSTDGVLGLLGGDKVSEFASKLNLDSSQAASGLSGMIPQLLDQSSEGGSLMGNVASGLLKRLF